jgi:phosphoribosylformylglycinamidine synthase subunit PurQ / glutaminase
MKAGVVVFPGSNCDMDTVHAIEKVAGAPPLNVWHKDRVPDDMDLVVLPGGFSYGDYLRVGSIARFSPVMESVVEHARKGKLVIGICNGFQILLEAGLLPGAMMRNRGLHFVCRWVHLRVERNNTPFTRFEKQVIRVPIAHATGNYYIDDAGLKEIEDRGQVVFRYCGEGGEVTDQVNPNGSRNSIAGICNREGNVLGMMPHPERAVEEQLGSTDGLLFWESVLKRMA